ncbi:hypothetical protein R6Q57_014773 [Mikania cordata]
MSATEGLTRGMDVIDTGAPRSVPVGGATLGRIFNVLGEPIDNLGPVDNSTTFPIHRSAPAFIQLDTKLSIFETGIKVVDLLAPYESRVPAATLNVKGVKLAYQSQPSGRSKYPKGTREDGQPSTFWPPINHSRLAATSPFGKLTIRT